MERDYLHIKMSTEDKNRLKEKARALGLTTITEYIRKIAREEIVFLDQNTRKVFSLFALEEKK